MLAGAADIAAAVVATGLYSIDAVVRQIEDSVASPTERLASPSAAVPLARCRPQDPNPSRPASAALKVPIALVAFGWYGPKGGTSRLGWRKHSARETQVGPGRHAARPPRGRPRTHPTRSQARCGGRAFPRADPRSLDANCG